LQIGDTGFMFGQVIQTPVFPY